MSTLILPSFNCRVSYSSREVSALVQKTKDTARGASEKKRTVGSRGQAEGLVRKTSDNNVETVVACSKSADGTLVTQTWRTNLMGFPGCCCQTSIQGDVQYTSKGPEETEIKISNRHELTCCCRIVPCCFPMIVKSVLDGMLATVEKNYQVDPSKYD